jgi:hypothetical protein
MKPNLAVNGKYCEMKNERMNVEVLKSQRID